MVLALALFGGQLAFGQLCGSDPNTNCRPGDNNGDQVVGVTDAVYVIQYVFSGGPAPRPYSICSGDVNGDCIANITDAVYIIMYIFNQGPPPYSCSDWESDCTNPGDYNPGPWSL
ncbi:MAG: dockerin type I repeat-containing protein [bacterium]